MAEEKSVSEKLDAFLDSFGKRMDAEAEERKADRKRLDAVCSKMDAWDEEKKADKSRKDAEEKARMDAAEKEKEEKEKEEKAKADKARADAEEEEKKREEKAKADAARADSGTAAKIAALEAKIAGLEPAQLTGDELKAFSDAQVRAEPVYQAFGDSAGAPRWLNGETVDAYVRRLLGKVKQHSPKWKDKDLAKADASILDIAQEQIYADALQAAAHPTDLPAGQLRMIEKKDSAGRLVRTFVGNERAAWEPFTNHLHTGRFLRPAQR